jgi:putative aldouronate transport system permease protein
MEFKCNAQTPVTVKAAAYFLASLPFIIIYPFFQKYFVTGLNITGVKE